jgi:hypothetical protein
MPGSVGIILVTAKAPTNRSNCSIRGKEKNDFIIADSKKMSSEWFPMVNQLSLNGTHNHFIAPQAKAALFPTVQILNLQLLILSTTCSSACIIAYKWFHAVLFLHLRLADWPIHCNYSRTVQPQNKRSCRNYVAGKLNRTVSCKPHSINLNVGRLYNI